MKKKIVSRALLLVMVCMMALLATACSAKPYKSMDEFVASDELKAELASAKESLGNSGLDITVVAEGNKLVYVYTMQEQMDTAGMAEALKSGLDAQSATFENVAKSLTEAVDVENPTVVVRYLNNDGSEIYSQEFHAQ